MNNELLSRKLTAAAGAIYALIALVMLAAPRWFYTAIGYFPPYNRHYLGDAAAFALALGIGLLLASRDVKRHRLMIAVSAFASTVHLVNHFVDAGHHASLFRLSFDIVPLTLVALGLIVAYYQTPRLQSAS